MLARCFRVVFSIPFSQVHCNKLDAVSGRVFVHLCALCFCEPEQTCYLEGPHLPDNDGYKWSDRSSFRVVFSITLSQVHCNKLDSVSGRVFVPLCASCFCEPEQTCYLEAPHLPDNDGYKRSRRSINHLPKGNGGSMLSVSLQHVGKIKTSQSHASVWLIMLEPLQIQG